MRFAWVLLFVACDAARDPQPPWSQFSALGAGAAAGALYVHVDGDRGGAGVDLDLGISSARFVIDRDERGAVLRTLEIPIGDLSASSAVAPPDGLRLHALVLTLPAPLSLAIENMTSDALMLAAKTDLSLDWSLVVADGDAYRLGPASVAGMAITFELSADGYLSLNAACVGPCWSIPKLIAARDVSLHLDTKMLLGPADPP